MKLQEKEEDLKEGDNSKLRGKKVIRRGLEDSQNDEIADDDKKGLTDIATIIDTEKEDVKKPPESYIKLVKFITHGLSLMQIHFDNLGKKKRKGKRRKSKKEERIKLKQYLDKQIEEKKKEKIILKHLDEEEDKKWLNDNKKLKDEQIKIDNIIKNKNKNKIQINLCGKNKISTERKLNSKKKLDLIDYSRINTDIIKNSNIIFNNKNPNITISNNINSNNIFLQTEAESETSTFDIIDQYKFSDINEKILINEGGDKMSDNEYFLLKRKRKKIGTNKNK